MRGFLTYFVVFVIAFSNLVGQNYNFSHFSLDEGLSQSQVFSIAQADNGNIWFGTLGGAITIYNGAKVKYLTTVEGLPDYRIWELFTASDGKVWIGTSTNLACHNGYKIKVFDKEFDDIRQICEDKNSVIWFSSDTAIYRVIDDKIEKFEADVFISPSVFCDSKGQIWYYGKKGIVRFSDNEKNLIFQKNDLYGEVIFEDKQNNLWFGTHSGLYFFNGNKFKLFTKKDGLPANTIFDITQDKNGNIWIATENSGISVFNGHNFLNINTDNGLGIEYIPSIFCDKQNNVWVGTDGDGVYLFKNFIFKQYLFDTIADNNFIMCLYVNNQKDMWFGTDGGGAIRKKGDDYEVFTTSNGMVSNYVYDIIKDNDGNYWFGTLEGLSKYDGKKFENYTTETNEKFLSNYIMSLYEDNSGNIWVGTNGAGLLKFEGNKIINNFNSIDASTIWDIYQSQKGFLYFASDNGLYVISSKDTLHYSEKDGLNVPGIGTVIEDENGIIWLGTDKGISRFDGKDFINYTRDDGLSSDISYFVHFDKNGYLISGTENGIDKIKFDEKGKIISIRYFRKEDGFFGIECNLNAVKQDSAGIIYIGTINGVTIYNPFIKEDTVSPIVNITNIKLFYEDIKWNKYTDSILPFYNLPYKPILPYNKNNLTFEFNAIEYQNPENVKYRFMLKGFDKKWMPITDLKFATYSNIPPGKYVFMVKALSARGIWSDIAKFEFEIKKPFWQTALFYIIAGVLIIGLLRLYIYLRTKRLKRAKIILQNKVKERTAEILQQKEEIEAQRDEIEAQKEVALEQRDEIMKQQRKIKNSIIYAQRIQNAIFPQSLLFKNYFQDYFIFFRPRDIVSGDFYWIKDTGNYVVFAVADCTGHGVPGAFMSLLGISFLNEIVVRKEINQTSQVLEILRTRIKNALKQTKLGSKSRDGIDIALCCINKKRNILQYSGANIPLYIVHNKNKNKLSIHKPDRQPIGVYVKERKFTQINLQLFKNDCVYLSTDGFVDQLGGNNRTKFLTKNFRKLLPKIADKNLIEQKNIIENTFNDWKDDIPQLDDVLVVGIRI